MELNTYIIGALIFIGGAVSKKSIDYAVDCFLGRIGGVRLLGDAISFDYDINRATYKHYHDKVWMDVPFDIEFCLYNQRKSVRTLHSPQVRFHLDLEVRNDMGLITGETTYLTTIFDFPVSLDPEKHEQVKLRGWASFCEYGKDEAIIKSRLLNVIANVLPRFVSASLYFKDARTGRKISFGAQIRYLVYDGVRPVDTG